MASKIGQVFLGSPNRIEQTSRHSPETQRLLQQILQGGFQGLQNPYQGFDAIENRARSQFQQNTIPSLAERFTSMGNGSLSSPAFISQLGQSGAGLEEGLAALRSQYGMQNRQQSLSQLSEALGGLSYENMPMQGQEGILQHILKLLARAGGAYATGGLSELGNLGSIF